MEGQQLFNNQYFTETLEKNATPRSEPKSLFLNILAVSACGSIFYPDSAQHRPRKPLRMNILDKRRGKS